MADDEVPAGDSGGPSWLQGGPRRLASPAAVLAEPPPTQFKGAIGAKPGSSEDLFSARYSRNGITPIPFMIVSFVAMGAAWWAIDWSEIAPGATDPVRSSEWWINVTSVLLPGEDLRAGSYSTFRMAVALGLLVFAAIVLALWIGRIGSNVRSGHAPFGAFLPIVAFPAWWLLPVTIGITGDASRSRSDIMLRYLVAFAILFTQFLIVRWPTLNRIWRAGHLRYDLASIILWLPMMIPWSMIFLSTAFTYLAIGEDGKVSDSTWRPTEGMLDWARWLTRASGIGLLILLVVVTILQHIGMEKDKADDNADRAQPIAVRIPV